MITARLSLNFVPHYKTQGSSTWFWYGMAYGSESTVTSGIQDMAIEASQPLDQMDGDIDEAKPVQ